MNGIEPPADFMTPKALKQKHLGHERLRLILGLVASNIFVLCCTLILGQNKAEQMPEANILFPGHEIIHLALQSFVPVGSEPRRVSILNDEGVAVIQSAYISHPTQTLSFFNQRPEYQLQVPSSDLDRLVPYQDQTLRAYPYQEEFPTTSKPRNIYEITL